MTLTVNRAAIYEAAEELSNWGRWGQDDYSLKTRHSS